MASYAVVLHGVRKAAQEAREALTASYLDYLDYLVEEPFRTRVVCCQPQGLPPIDLPPAEDTVAVVVSVAHLVVVFVLCPFERSFGSWSSSSWATLPEV